MHRALHGRIFLAGIIFFVLISARASRAQNQAVHVFVFSDVQVTASVLKTAEQRASMIFAQAGVDIAWVNCLHGAGDPESACMKTLGLGDLVLRITSHLSHATADTAFGVAWLGDNGTGRYADIFWSRVEDLRARTNVETGLVLGSVMAHETGHLLLGANSHSVAGLMQAHWRNPELSRITMGTLFFLPDEGKKMRATVSGFNLPVLAAGQAQRHGVP